MTEITIPFNRPPFMGTEIQHIERAYRYGKVSGDGLFTKKCHELLKAHLGAHAVLLTTSCTHALEMTALLLDIQPGDEVIIPAYTFTSVATAFVLRGAKPVFADIEPWTLNLCLDSVKERITQKTRAIVAVHYAGVGFNLEELCALANKHNLPLVEDTAHGLFGNYRGKPLGTFGGLATLSFHETKNFSCGEGGALVINDPVYYERALIIREKGTNRAKFFRGDVDKYSWVDQGSSYLPSDILAAVLYAQLERWQDIQGKRRAIWVRYQVGLLDWAKTYGIKLPHIPPDVEQAFHMFYLIMPTLEVRQAFIRFLRDQGILAVFHYVSLHLSEMGRRFGGQVGDCPVSERMSDTLVRLPFFYGLSDSEQDRVIETVLRFRPSSAHA